jgi:hypothetical protein
MRAPSVFGWQAPEAPADDLGTCSGALYAGDLRIAVGATFP